MLTGTIQHEFMHALGFLHEHVRPDRDQHVDVFHDRVVDKFKSQYAVMSTNDWAQHGSPYDYNSVMHYGSYVFNTNRYQPTMLKRDGGEIVANTKYLTSIDAHQIAHMYKCNVESLFTRDHCDNGHPLLPERRCDGFVECRGHNFVTIQI